MRIDKLNNYFDYKFLKKGSSSSGNFDHAGRPGLVGGSSSDRTTLKKLSDRQLLDESTEKIKTLQASLPEIFGGIKEFSLPLEKLMREQSKLVTKMVKEVTSNPSVTLQSSISKVSDIIRLLPYEHEILLDKYGKLIAIEHGDESGIDFSPKTLRNLKNNYSIHNHEGGEPLSPADVTSFFLHNMQELHAVTPDGSYKLSRPKDTVWTPKIAKEISSQYEKGYNEKRPKVQVSQEDFLKTIHNATMLTLPPLADKYNFNYWYDER